MPCVRREVVVGKNVLPDRGVVSWVGIAMAPGADRDAGVCVVLAEARPVTPRDAVVALVCVSTVTTDAPDRGKAGSAARRPHEDREEGAAVASVAVSVEHVIAVDVMSIVLP